MSIAAVQVMHVCYLTKRVRAYEGEAPKRDKYGTTNTLNKYYLICSSMLWLVKLIQAS